MKPLALEAYERLAERFARIADDKLENAYLDRPATLSLLPVLAGKTVVDAGCGAGAYSEEFLSRGAKVTAFDVSPKMVEQARKRLGDAARVLMADFSEPLDFLKDESVDVVVCGLAICYVEDPGFAYAEFYRALKSGGHLVVSIGHPWNEMKFSKTGNYFESEVLSLEWRGFGEPIVEVSWFRKSLTDILEALFEKGFLLDRFLEPKPVPEGRSKDPETYDRLCRIPGFLCFRALKPEG
jgi:SAM-dependent methyltransferase